MYAEFMIRYMFFYTNQVQSVFWINKKINCHLMAISNCGHKNKNIIHFLYCWIRNELTFKLIKTKKKCIHECNKKNKRRSKFAICWMRKETKRYVNKFKLLTVTSSQMILNLWSKLIESKVLYVFFFCLYCQLKCIQSDWIIIFHRCLSLIGRQQYIIYHLHKKIDRQ